MVYAKSCLLAVSFFPMVLAAQNLVKNGDAEAGLSDWDDEVQLVAENPRSGKNCFQTLVTDVLNSGLIPVDTSKKYRISGWFRSADDKKTVFYLGLVPFDADKKQIQCFSVNAVTGSETELAEACKAGDTVLKVKNASGWLIRNKYDHIAFETDNSGAYGDLPNSRITSPIVKVEQKDNLWEVTLEKPCGKAYSTNTPVRIQRDGATYMYPVSCTEFQYPEWKEFSAEITGEAKSGVHRNQFWTKTKYVKIVVLALQGGMIYFDDLKFEEVK